MGLIRVPGCRVCFNGKCRKGPSIFMSDHAPGSFVDFPGVILLSFQGDTKLIIFTSGEKKSTDCVSLFVEENANFFPNKHRSNMCCTETWSNCW